MFYLQKDNFFDTLLFDKYENSRVDIDFLLLQQKSFTANID